jgi:hypothetical protein
MDRAVAGGEKVQNDNDANVDQAAQRTITANGRTLASNEQIFPKLGITSRAALRDALAALPPVRSGQDRSRP